MNAKIKNLVKSAVLGVAVLGGAVAMQSFSEKIETEKSQRPNLAFRYVNNGTKFIEAPNADPSEGCSGTNPYHCVIETNQNMGPEFEYANLPNDWQPYGESEEGVYDPE